ncbi:phage tail protein [Microtetraspora malaysiensis]|uniref:phage tail protein n=1 Tax=Microtetraspora malaysiensis TaxID=161358 RepID=UPI003D8A8220
MNTLRDAAKKFNVDAGDMSKRAGAMGVQFTGMALKAATLAAAMASAAQSALGLVAALAPAGGIVAALPGAIALGVGAMATLKLAMAGVGDAFKAVMEGDPKKIAAALEGLSPAARSAALELQTVKPALDGLKSAVQDAFFAPLAGQLSAVTSALVGPLRDGMAGVASEFGRAGAQVAQFLASAQTASAVSAIFGSLRSAVAAIQPVVQPLLAGFRDLAVVGAQFSAGFAPGIASAAQRFGEFLSRAADSGAALGWMQGAMDVFRQLGSIVGNLSGILKGVFAAMRTGGSDALGVIGQLLGKVNEFVNSAQGQQILVTIFKALSQVGQALSPIIGALAGALAKVAPHIANIATALGPGLAAAVTALGPALAALGPGLTTVAEMLAKAFASPELQAGLLALGQGISAALAAVAPLLPVVGQLAGIIGQVLGLALQNLSTILGPVISALASALQPALASISTALAQLSPLIPPIAASFGAILGAVVEQLLPPILNLIPALLDSLVPAFVQLMQTVTPLLPTLTQLAVMFISKVLPAVLPIIPELTKITEGFATFGAKVGEVVALVKPYIDQVVGVFTWMYNTLVGHSVIPDMVNGIGRWIGTTLVGFFRDLPGKIISAVGDIGSRVAQLGRDIVSGIWNGIQSMASTFYNQVRGFFSGIVDSVKGALGINSPSKVFATIGRFMMQGLAVGVDRTSGLVATSLNKVASLAAKTAMPDLSLPGVTVPDGLAGGRALSRTVVNVTNHYPQAEPTSVSVNRSLQYVGAIGVI